MPATLILAAMLLIGWIPLNDLIYKELFMGAPFTTSVRFGFYERFLAMLLRQLQHQSSNGGSLALRVTVQQVRTGTQI